MLKTSGGSSSRLFPLPRKGFVAPKGASLRGAIGSDCLVVFLVFMVPTSSIEWYF